ncbi:PAS domain-containing sensor histidine kinase [Anaeromyxobacter oryzisoli]|uniref:PAS domain-containing sensor histidine kinase n=1 Tax=Anaeromyxobacter oryzisoli TaxID=2925408 RepID=UPI001F579888|nr:PAS domain-containing sensor histidine kinase [Anaeromyxobacter sp. SG63]
MIALRLPPPPRLPAFATYPIAVALPLLALSLKLLLEPVAESTPFVFFYPAVLVAAYLGGLGPGGLATALSAVLANRVVLPLSGAWASSPKALGATLLFTLMGALLVLASASIRAGYADRRESERRLRLVLETIPQLVLVIAADGEVDYANPQLLAFTGRTSEDLAAARLGDLFHPEERERARAEWNRLLASGAAATAEHRLRSADGSHRWFLISAVPLHALAGDAHWFVSCTDIQAQKESEQAQAEAIAARDVFMSVASHELKTPIASALLQVQHAERLLRRDGAPAEAVCQRLSATAASVARLGGLVEALLDVSRIAMGRLVLERARFDLSGTVRDAAGRHGDAARRAGCELEVAVAPGIAVDGDRLRIEQVLTNLLANALKYGAGAPVRVSLRREGALAILEVADHGIGIAPEDQARIFEQFERAVSARHYGGLGLGLWIARQLVDASGGAIHVESAPGRGATFWVALPAPAEVATPEPARELAG